MQLISFLGLKESQCRSLTLEGCSWPFLVVLVKKNYKLCARPVSQPQADTQGCVKHALLRQQEIMTWRMKVIVWVVKTELMSLRLAEEMIFSLRTRNCANHVGFYVIPYIQAHILGVGSTNTRKCNFWCWKKSCLVLDHLVRDSCWMAVGWPQDVSIFTSYPYDLILLH